MSDDKNDPMTDTNSSIDGGPMLVDGTEGTEGVCFEIEIVWPPGSPSWKMTALAQGYKWIAKFPPEITPKEFWSAVAKWGVEVHEEKLGTPIRVDEPFANREDFDAAIEELNNLEGPKSSPPQASTQEAAKLAQPMPRAGDEHRAGKAQHEVPAEQGDIDAREGTIICVDGTQPNDDETDFSALSPSSKENK